MIHLLSGDYSASPEVDLHCDFELEPHLPPFVCQNHRAIPSHTRDSQFQKELGIFPFDFEGYLACFGSTSLKPPLIIING
jgi:hypothetical protein